jgi:DMSO reductase family type II enzyme chaperone
MSDAVMVVSGEAEIAGALGSEVETALARSALYQALALGLGVPTASTILRLASPAGAAGLRVAAALLDADGLLPRVDRLAAIDVDLATVVATYGRLFGHTVRGAVPAYETEYGADDLFQQPQEMADVAGFYAAFGLVLAAEAGERPDHASCECEFLMVLARKEALALHRDDTDTLTVVRRATRLFLRDHLARFVPAFAVGLVRDDAGGFYGALGALLDAFVAWECAHLDVTPGSLSLRLRSPVEDQVPMACGSCHLAPGAENAGDAD